MKRLGTLLVIAFGCSALLCEAAGAATSGSPRLLSARATQLSAQRLEISIDAAQSVRVGVWHAGQARRANRHLGLWRASFAVQTTAGQRVVVRIRLRSASGSVRIYRRSLIVHGRPHADPVGSL
jgi:hypothetical protein